MREGTLLLVAGFFFVFVSRVQRLGGTTLWLLGWVVFRWRIAIAGLEFAHDASFMQDWLRLDYILYRLPYQT